MTTTFEKMLTDDCIELVENKKYYLIETFRHEQMIGTIKQGQIYKFIRVDVLNRYGDGIEYSKYISTGSIAAMTPISKDTAMELAKVAKPVNRSISSLTTNNDDGLCNTYADKNKAMVNNLEDNGSLSKSVKSVKSVINNAKESLSMHRVIRTRISMSLFVFLAVFVLSMSQNLSSEVFLAVCVAPVTILLTSLVELAVLD